ncbi:MAG: 5-oxoprolinase subunit PxpA [Lentimonas sp.]
MDRLILNCDLGENESAEQTEQLMSLLDAANICCGVHAGNVEKTRETLKIAKAHHVLIGAHPGMPSAGGRGSELPSGQLFRELLLSQLTVFMELADELQVEVAYIKLHGSLYSAVETSEELLAVYLETLRELDRPLGVVALAGGCCVAACRNAKLKVWEEAFADRAYLSDGSLVKRSDSGAVLDMFDALSRYKHWREHGDFLTLDGATIALRADTFCVHSDSPNALELLRAIVGEGLSLD